MEQSRNDLAATTQYKREYSRDNDDFDEQNYEPEILGETRSQR